MARRPSSALQSGRRLTDADEEVGRLPQRKPRQVMGRRHLMTFRKNQFSELVERTVDALKGSIAEDTDRLLDLKHFHSCSPRSAGISMKCAVRLTGRKRS